jgi:hypothetical protein
MPHSCGRYSVAKFLAGKSKEAISLYEHFSSLVHECGPVQIAPAKTRIGFQVRMIFAAVKKLSDRGLEAHVVPPPASEGISFYSHRDDDAEVLRTSFSDRILK